MDMATARHNRHWAVKVITPVFLPHGGGEIGGYYAIVRKR